jgi:capsular polysaccharide export protein
MLGQRLAGAGHGVRRINFNGGDKLYWRGPEATDYRGTLKGWPVFLDRYLDRAPATDIVLFGDCRPLHAAAIQVARARGMQIHVFEEGYIRPDYVTVEAEGVNGHSTLPRNPEEYLRAARALAAAAGASADRLLLRPARARGSDLQSRQLPADALVPGYRTHRPWHILVEYIGWAARLLRKPSGMRQIERDDRSAERRRAALLRLPLQLDCDYQIRVHSGFGASSRRSSMCWPPSRRMRRPMRAGGEGPPARQRLDRLGEAHAAVAAKLGISDRVLFAAWADIDPIVRAARGVVTVNSTTGTLALRYGVPTIVLGDAVYNIPRITHQTGLAAFWSKPQAPEAEVFDAFRRVLVDRCLIHGGYFSDEGLEMLIEGAAARIEASMPGAPAVRVTAPAAATVDGFRAASLRG